MAELEWFIYRDVAGEWRWSLRSTGNHAIVGTSGEGYKSLTDCFKAVQMICFGARDAVTHFDEESFGSVTP